VIIPKVLRWFDERLGAASFAKKSLRKVFPDHWSFMLAKSRCTASSSSS
jgi:ubiquinol-cytochrome c reductase cytochrome b subunit